ncbi:MAG: 16S rRNA (guanine(966)-N(2))-methyltransferase RsmD [Alphaproteobacteria bacterium]|nr:16S rRNA (guanine(966)-N(2))-methyltransferase RsmD [Alphaproteobacteria bacterium]
MRIVAGRLRGRALAAPPGRLARPTADRARETLFSMLNSRIDFDGIRVLDAFAGSGALGFEALSRGAAHATFLETNPACLAVLRDNARALGEEGRVTILRADATKPPPAPSPCDLALLDPPYEQGLGPPALAALAKAGWLAADALTVIEVAAREVFVPPEGFIVGEERESGAARFVFV